MVVTFQVDCGPRSNRHFQGRQVSAPSRAAVGEAAFMTGLERNSDVVQMASYAPLFPQTSLTVGRFVATLRSKRTGNYTHGDPNGACALSPVNGTRKVQHARPQRARTARAGSRFSGARCTLTMLRPRKGEHPAISPSLQWLTRILRLRLTISPPSHLSRLPRYSLLSVASPSALPGPPSSALFPPSEYSA
jgi:Alpha-L-arabinofuranosidase C-terminal domain